MSFMDKVKASAENLTQKAQETVAQGQAKVEELQVKRSADALLRELGAATYAAERQGGDKARVAKALGDLDVHLNQHGPIDTAPTGAGSAAAPPTASTPATPPTAPPPVMTPPASSAGSTTSAPQVSPTVPPA
ncbi:MAG: hypothetical protein M3Z02_00175 [Actinomycetota bacterium]|nr:hypothetical protein [Actinomycetota bacterium]